MNANTTNTTRRAILGGAAVAATVPHLALAADNSRDGVSLDLKRRIAAYRAAQRAADRYEEQVLDPALARYLAAKDAVPHVTVPCGDRELSTADRVHIEFAMGVQETPSAAYVKPEVVRAYRQLLAAHAARLAQFARLEESTGWREASDRHSDVLCEAVWTALAAVEAYPPQNVAELHAKLAFLIDVGAADSDNTLPRTLAEIAQLLPKA